MDACELKSVRADCVSAAASAAWRAWGIGLALQVLSSASYLLFVFSEPFRELVIKVWGVDALSARKVFIVFLSIQKLVMTNGLLICVFLHVLAKRLKAGCKA